VTAEARFRVLYAEHGQALLAYLLRRTSNPSDAADLLADVFVIVWRRIDDIPAGGGARPWLYGVARRTLANHRRGTVRRQALAETLAARLETATVPDPPLRDSGLFEALRSLGERDREIVCLTAWEQLTPKEIGRVLGMNPATVRVQLHRARAKLADEVGPEFRRSPATRPA
jgi:RNA polymerase sigma-70 factor (ECF subfamily)